MKKYYATFGVKGFGRFPIDMFRYDRCFPNSEIDSGKINRTFDFFSDNWEVTLGAYCEDKKWVPTEGRWNSFCCSTYGLELRKLT